MASRAAPAPAPAGLAAAGPHPAGLTLSGIDKRFGAVEALADVTLTVEPGEVLALTGPSGAGKTTLCRIVAGLERPDAGSCRLGGRELAGVPAGARRVAYMFESYALYPHLTVAANVASPLSAPNGGGLAAGRIEAAVAEVLELLEIRHLGHRLPAELSGGQKQRVALARALVQSPTATLLDEPISHLDAKLRHKLRGEIRTRLSARPTPTIWCTPDGMEALSVGDRVAVIEAGRIAQVGTPEEIWLAPATASVARLIGDPPMNLIGGRVTVAAGETAFVRAGLTVPLAGALAAAAGRLASTGGPETVILGIRPNRITVVPAGTPGAAAVEIYSHEPFGKHAIVTVRLDGVLVKAKTTAPAVAAIGAPAGLVVPPDGLALFDAAGGAAVV